MQHNYERGPQEGKEINLIQSNRLLFSHSFITAWCSLFQWFIHAEFYLQYIKSKKTTKALTHSSLIWLYHLVSQIIVTFSKTMKETDLFFS